MTGGGSWLLCHAEEREAAVCCLWQVAALDFGEGLLDPLEFGFEAADEEVEDFGDVAGFIGFEGDDGGGFALSGFRLLCAKAFPASA